MEDNEMSPVAKRLIVASGIAGMLIVAAVFKAALHPESVEIIKSSAVSGFSLVLGSVGSLLVRNKPTLLKIVVFLFGLGLFFISGWLFNTGYIGIGVYVAGFILAGKDLNKVIAEK